MNYQEALAKFGCVCNVFDFIRSRGEDENESSYHENTMSDIRGKVDLMLSHCKESLSKPIVECNNAFFYSAMRHLMISIILYIFTQAPSDEQNMCMLVALLKAGKEENPDGTKIEHTDLCRLFQLLKEKDISQPEQEDKQEEKEVSQSEKLENMQKETILSEFNKFRLLAQTDVNANKIYKALLKLLKPIVGEDTNFVEFVNKCSLHDIDRQLAIMTVDNFKPTEINRDGDEYWNCVERFVSFFNKLRESGITGTTAAILSTSGTKEMFADSQKDVEQNEDVQAIFDAFVKFFAEFYDSDEARTDTSNDVSGIDSLQLGAVDAPLIVSIEGPIGSEVSVIAQAVSSRFGIHTIDVELIYFSLIELALEMNIELDEAVSVALFVDQVSLAFVWDENQISLLIDSRKKHGIDSLAEIYYPDLATFDRIVSLKTSEVLQSKILKLVRDITAHYHTVICGCGGIGGYLAQNSLMKFFIFSTTEDRAERVAERMKTTYDKAMGYTKHCDRQLGELNGKMRMIIPDNAIIADTTGYSEDETISEVINAIEERLPNHSEARENTIDVKYAKQLIMPSEGREENTEPKSRVEGRYVGKIKWFNNKKGYGFIEDSEEQDIFVHFTSIVSHGSRTIEEGQCVRFDIDDGEKGLQATNVTISDACSVEVESKDSPASNDSNGKVSIPVVELFDDSGNKVIFELLDTIEFNGSKYTLLTPYYETEEEYDLDDPADVFVMKEVLSENNDEPMLETVEDEELLQTVYSLFKNKHGGDFSFRDN